MGGAQAVIGTLERGNPMGKVVMAVVLLELIAFALAVPVMIKISDVPGSTAALAGGAVVLLCLISAALMRGPAGYLLGWITQLAGIALGLLTPLMFVVGVMFLGLYALTYVLGRRLESGQVDYAAQPPGAKPAGTKSSGASPGASPGAEPPAGTS